MYDRRPVLRRLILAASLLAFAAPAYAQSSQTFPEDLDEDIVRSLPHPAQVEDMADTAGRAAEAILDVPVGGLVRAIDPSRRVHRDDTVEDVMGDRDPYVRERIRNSASDLAVGMGDIVAQMAVIAPELRRSLAGLEQSIDRSMRDARDRRRGRDYDRGYDRDYDRDYDRR
jgi:hypothetical protein